MKIRNNWGSMPYDNNGNHATGREVFRVAADGIHYNWFPEYEGDDTEDLPITDPDYYPEDDCVE